MIESLYTKISPLTIYSLYFDRIDRYFKQNDEMFSIVDEDLEHIFIIQDGEIYYLPDVGTIYE